ADAVCLVGGLCVHGLVEDAFVGEGVSVVGEGVDYGGGHLFGVCREEGLGALHEGPVLVGGGTVCLGEGDAGVGGHAVELVECVGADSGAWHSDAAYCVVAHFGMIPFVQLVLAMKSRSACSVSAAVGCPVGGASGVAGWDRASTPSTSWAN